MRKHLVEDQGFTRSKTDPCLYRLENSDGEILLGIYVDDIIVSYRGKKLFNTFSTKFENRFRCGQKTSLRWFLGMAVTQHDDYSIDLDQSQYISKMVDKYIPHNSVTRTCPSPDLFNKLDRAQSPEERARVREKNYLSIVGALLYVSTMTRADVAFHTSVLAKFMSDPSEDCYKAAIELLQYLHTTDKRKLTFSGKVTVPDGLYKYSSDIERNHGFVAYSDSSWGNKYPYPMFGYSIYLFGGLVSFSSKQLKVVAFSSCEAEYAAASNACKEIEFVRHICEDMGVTLHGRLVLGVDNSAVLDIAHDVGVSARTKHFDRAIHYLRDLTQSKRVLPAYVSTKLQRADGYTKALDKSHYASWQFMVMS